MPATSPTIPRNSPHAMPATAETPRASTATRESARRVAHRPGLLPTLIRRTPATVAAMRAGSADRSPGCRREEHPPGHAPLPARQSGTVPEDNGGEPVPSEDVQASADEEGGHAERAAEVLGGGLKQLRQGRRPRCAVPVGLGRPEQMVPFLLGRALCVGQGVRHLSRHAYAVALVQVCVALRDRRNSLSLARRSVRQTLRRRSLHVQTSLSSVCRTCSQARSSAASPAGRRAVDQVAHRVASPPGPTARPRGCGGTYPSPRLGSCYVPAGRAEPATLLLTPLMMPLMMPCWVTARERRSNSPNPYRPVAPLSQ